MIVLPLRKTIMVPIMVLMNTTPMNAADRRSNLNRAIEYRDELLEIAAGLLAADEAVTLSNPRDVRAIVDLHGDMVSFLDGALCKAFPGVAARMRDGLAAMGWTWDFAMNCLAKHNANMREIARPSSGKCGKCDGKGKLNAFGHIANGVCFACKGAGRIEFRR